MINKFKHTLECTQCKTTEQFDLFPDETDCKCGGEMKYIGLQPYVNPILQKMLDESKKSNTRNVINEESNNEVNETEVNEIEVNETEVNQMEINQTEVNQTEVNQMEINETEVNQTEEISEVENENVTTNESTLTINDIFDTTQKMTNGKMEPLMKEFIKNSEVEKIKLLYEYYTSTFEKTIKYIGKKNQTKLKELMADFQ